MLLPDRPAAEAQGVTVQAGYHYTQMICQEWGQQPRWYTVRDPIPGSDWRNDGGWVIILVRGGGNTRTILSAPSYQGGPVPIIELTTPVRREKTQFTDSSTGITGFLAYFSNGDLFGGWIVIDRNNDGRITAAGDRTAGPSGNQWEYRTYTSEVYGGRYIRWANMAWCRQPH